MWNEVVEIGGPEDLGFVTFAERLVAASGKPGRIKHIPLIVLRAMAVLARPFSPGFARQASNNRSQSLTTSSRSVTSR